MSPTFLGGHTPRNGDTELIVMQKILGALVDFVAGGGGGVGAAQIYTGAAPPATPTVTTSPAVFYPAASAPPGTNWQSWDVATQAWI